MPPNVTMLEVNIMYDRGYSPHGNIHLIKEYVGRLVYHTLVGVNATQNGVTLVQIKMDYKSMIKRKNDLLINQYLFHLRRAEP